MDKKKAPYSEGKIEIICFSSNDVIATSGEGSLGGEDGTGGWTGT